ncbi:MAG: 2-hydroxyacyl-CoA dehydratase [Spirochaetales bacterium]|nr:2-hydroxyacyl-CoA dehydratase [Spirochaetales bacterium]
MKKVGLTTTVPVEVVFAAGCVPVDLNNLFIVAPDSQAYTEFAELAGFPRSICAWIKGLYSVALQHNIDTVVGVVEGDCSNTRSLIDIWKLKGLEIVPFGFPYSKDYSEIERQICRLMEFFSVEKKDVIRIQHELYPIRQRLKYLDSLTWEANLVSGFENHLWQVSASDFCGDYKKFAQDLEDFIATAEARTPYPDTEVRLGLVGVPPILKDLYDVVDSLGGRVVFNEVQQAFTLADQPEDADINQMYLDFSYPYGVEDRIEAIKIEIEKRRLDGIIHYTQSFCHRGIDDIMFKSKLDLPILTIEGDLPGNCDSRTRLRLDSFLDMLKDLKESR